MRAAVKLRIGLWIRRWWTLFLLPAGLLLIWLAHSFPAVTEQVYSGARRMEAPADTAAESRMRHFFHICYDLWTELPSFGICTDKRSANP